VSVAGPGLNSRKRPRIDSEERFAQRVPIAAEVGEKFQAERGPSIKMVDDLADHDWVLAEQLTCYVGIPQTIDKAVEALLRGIPGQQTFQAGDIELQHHDLRCHLKKRPCEVGRQRFFDGHRIERGATEGFSQTRDTPPYTVKRNLNQRTECNKTIGETAGAQLLRQRS